MHGDTLLNDGEAWKAWAPGLDNDHLMLDEVRASLPGNDPEEIHFMVRLFENPASPIAFPGAVNLDRHDCIHIVLGRGLMAQDEAFVIGYTMGTSKSIRQSQVWAFKKIARYAYPHFYRMSDDDLLAFELGFGAGLESPVDRIYDIALEAQGARKLGHLRRQLGINKNRLRAVYRHEQILLPHTPESRRLPIGRGIRRGVRPDADVSGPARG